MPQIELLPIPLYEPLQPYHFQFDNIPLQALMTRQSLINSAVDINSDILRDTAGTQGSLAARLNQSINPDGSLKSDKIDAALHSIGAHTDGLFDGIEYVRYKLEERDKLILIADEATNMTLEFDTISNIVLFEEGPVIFQGSDSVTWSVLEPNRIKADLTFPTSAAHRHYYGIAPLPVDVDPDYINYKTGLTTPFVEGSLRVYINGVRLSDEDEIYIPGPLVTSEWTLNRFTPGADFTTFALDRAITANDSIRIDFDISLI